MVTKDRVDVFVHDAFTVGTFLCKKGPRYIDVHPLDPPLEIIDYYTFLLAKHTAKAPVIEKVLKSMKEDASYNRIMVEGNP
jgi:hypothetical protein